jgi:hypothetical protein
VDPVVAGRQEKVSGKAGTVFAASIRSVRSLFDLKTYVDADEDGDVLDTVDADVVGDEVADVDGVGLGVGDGVGLGDVVGVGDGDGDWLGDDERLGDAVGDLDVCTDADGDVRAEADVLAIDDGLADEDTRRVADEVASRLEAAPRTDEPDVGADVRAAGLVCSGVFGWWPIVAVRAMPIPAPTTIAPPNTHASTGARRRRRGRRAMGGADSGGRGTG